jgi:glycosyltransferase involved in cell wall biosynthesis
VKAKFTLIIENLEKLVGRKMKILLVNYSEITSPGGVHKTMLEISKNLSKKGHKITVLQGNPRNLPPSENYDGYKIIRVKSRIADSIHGLSFAIYNYLRKNLKDLNPDIIHVHGYHTLFSPEVIYLIKKMDPKIPIVFSPHFDIFSHDTLAGKYLWNVYNRNIGRRYMKYPDVVIAASDFEFNNINQILGVPKEKLKVIPHGINYSNLNKKDKISDVINILYVGYLLELKGVQYVIKAISELVYENNVKVCYRIVGDGPYKSELEKLSERLNVSQFISWEGFIPPSQNEKLKEFYRNSDIFLLLSQSENYGIVVPEALAMGTPVIVTKRTALNEFLNEPGCFGVEYPPDPKDVANLIVKIYKNNVKVGPFSFKVQNWDKITDQYDKIFSNLLMEK